MARARGSSRDRGLAPGLNRFGPPMNLSGKPVSDFACCRRCIGGSACRSRWSGGYSGLQSIITQLVRSDDNGSSALPDHQLAAVGGHLRAAESLCSAYGGRHAHCGSCQAIDHG
ncbi:MAG: hypothetical protein ACK55I_25400 [bacterium]